MNTTPDRATGCPSSYAMDLLVAGEHAPPAAAALQRHVAACPACMARVTALQTAQVAFAQTHQLPRPGTHTVGRPAVATPTRWWQTWQGWLLPSAGMVAVAAAALLVASPPPTSERIEATRIKGSLGMTFYVQRDGVVGEGLDRQVVHPGDALRFALVAASPGYAYLLGRDATGQAALYFEPPGQAPLAMGAEPMLLPDSIVLDATLGREAFWGLHCAAPQAAAELVAQLAQTGALHAVPGCAVATLTLEKHARR